MVTQNRLTVAKKLIAALHQEGFTPNCHPQIAAKQIAERIWTSRNSTKKSDAVRWGVDKLPCLLVNPCPYNTDIVHLIELSSCKTLTKVANDEEFSLIRRSTNNYEI